MGEVTSEGEGIGDGQGSGHLASITAAPLQSAGSRGIEINEPVPKRYEERRGPKIS
jgi:hypothetical protein